MTSTVTETPHVWLNQPPRRRVDPNIRFWAKVKGDDYTECWTWQGATDRGYGKFGVVQGQIVYAHRFAYEALRGAIPPGLVIDHLCRNRSCVNPWHLEPVTDRVNTVVRGRGMSAVNARKTHCKHGHEFTEENTYTLRGERWCRACGRRRKAETKARRRERESTT